ncbi:MAG: hypothetical protein Q8911_08525 [Bacillota bacterium]|nr:hypothetical protein [Bacillota bacterium]
MAKVKTSISLDEELYKKLMDKAQEQKRSFSQHISYIAETSKEVAFREDLEKIRAELQE